MAFKYSRKQKALALQNSSGSLKQAYEISERNLDYFARKGSTKDLNRAMQQHQDFEYALLYQQSPEYHKKIKQTMRRKNVRR